MLSNGQKLIVKIFSAMALLALIFSMLAPLFVGQ